jgi:uncharacterized protein (TIGR02265 family)
MSAAFPASTPRSTVKLSVFEGLYVHVLRVPPTGALADALRAAGYDLQAPEPEYSGRVWRDALAATCGHLHPQRPPAEVMQELGRGFIDGFLQTLAGRALGIALPMLGPEGVLRRLQRFMALGVPALRVTSYEDQRHSWRVEVQVPWAMADFDAGLIQGGVERTGTAVKVSVLERSDARYLLHVHW